MLPTLEDAVTQAAVRLRRLSEQGSKDAKEAVEQFNKTVLEEMAISLESVLQAMSRLFKCDTLYTAEKFIALEIFQDLLEELVISKEEVDLGDIPEALMRVKFLKNEKYVERAVVVYLQVILRLLRLVNTKEHQVNVFKVFCTLYMTKQFITSSRCGYLIPPMFKSFLREHPEFIGHLLDNEDKLIFCKPLLETVISSSGGMSGALSRLVVQDFLNRKESSILLAAQGKGFLEPFYFQMYIEKETGPVEDGAPIFAKAKFLEYLVLDVSLRLTSKRTLQNLVEKLCAASNRHLIRMIKDCSEAEECGYCAVSNRLVQRAERKKKLETALYAFNATGDAAEVAAALKECGVTDTAHGMSLFFRAHPDTHLSVLGKCIGKESNQELLEAFCNSFNFSELDLLAALRVFLLSFHLPGEGQQIERIIYAFCTRYAESRKQNFDTILSIGMSIIVLNTSIHNANTGKKITLEEFTTIVLTDCPSVSIEYLETLYDQIKHHMLQFPVSNDVSCSNTDFLTAVSAADTSLHRELLPEPSYNYCGRCSQNVYFYLLESFNVAEKVAETKHPNTIKEFVRACITINARTIAYEMFQKVSDPYLVIQLAITYKREVYHIWKYFVGAIAKIVTEPELTPTGTRFLRNIFAFGKEPKKGKKEECPDATLEEVVEITRTLPSSQLAELAETLLQHLTQTKTKTLGRLSYVFIQQNIERIGVLGPLLEAAVFSCQMPTAELLQICAAAPLLDLFTILTEIHYKPLKSTISSTSAILQFASDKAQGQALPEPEMAKIERWMIMLLGLEVFRFRNQDAVRNAWEKIEEIALKIDTMGHDSFEIFIKLRDALDLNTKLAIITNTKMYYKNINRVLLCLDILQSADNNELEERILAVISELLEKDLEGFSSILESCENVIEKTVLSSKIDTIVFEKIKDSPSQQTKYLEKVFAKMSIKEAHKQEVIDL
ncbi:hypothetical protein NEDG_02135 [Nematocida displodere]|uniref:SEC7 domain-containing protein n=1 Tax=Nematocida displodere TaxID=1805483 RepID=A0A177EDK9_9MICR|nr:hypothetical protein NEDG_01445 [Nematocida displodere]OAG32268.1 hypothetical protein NEDG_02135 [Nematocida displodere]